MIEDTRISRRSRTDDTIPVRLRWHLDDTQPAVRAAPPADRTRRARAPAGIRLLTLLLAVVLLAMATMALGIGAYSLWQWGSTLPRLNVLILGLDRRPGQSAVVRSDTMILMTADPAAPRLALLSIPRDLYVDIPGYGANRINTAHLWGESGVEGGGPALAVQTVAGNLNVAVDRYVRVDFDGFRAVVDAAGGIDVVVAEPIVDPAYPTDDYGTMRIEIAAGAQHMDGETALRYARSRHSSSDFDRAQRQQQIISALGRQMLRPRTWPRLPAVYLALTGKVDTDLTPRDLLLLAFTLWRTGPDGIERYAIDRDMTQPWTTSGGGAVLLPRWEAINPLVRAVFPP
jgi:LCP family protein required for cell wall assembly